MIYPEFQNLDTEAASSSKEIQSLCLCETPEGLRGFENVTEASIDTVLSGK